MQLLVFVPFLHLNAVGMWTAQRNSAVPLGIKWVANLQKCLKTKLLFKYERKFWRTARNINDLQERRAADFSWHFGKKFLHEIIQDLNLIFCPIPPIAQTNKTSKWLLATGTDQSTQLFTEIYFSVNIKVFKGGNNSAMATKTILLPMVVKHSHNIPNFVECTQLWIY